MPCPCIVGTGEGSSQPQRTLGELVKDSLSRFAHGIEILSKGEEWIGSVATSSQRYSSKAMRSVMEKREEHA